MPAQKSLSSPVPVGMGAAIASRSPATACASSPAARFTTFRDGSGWRCSARSASVHVGRARNVRRYATKRRCSTASSARSPAQVLVQ